MANEQQVTMLRDSVRIWNLWRRENPGIAIDLSKADLSEAELWEANLSGANLREAHLSSAQLYRADLYRANLYRADLYRAYLSGADLRETDLSEAKLRRANLIGAYLSGAAMIAADLSGVDLREASLSGAYLGGARLYKADLSDANLSGANLTGTNLSGANLTGTDLSEADLSEADLSETICIGTKFSQATLTGCRVYGSANWDVQLDNATQEALCITPVGQPAITVDHLAVAQFVYLMLNNQMIRQVIDTITSKVVLILGCFTPERKDMLDALREELRERDYLPIVFDFDGPAPSNLIETVSLLARMARFVIADLTDAKSVLQELADVLPQLPAVAVQPLMQADEAEHSTLEHWVQFPSVLDIYRYQDLDSLLASLKECVIDPAEQRAKELTVQQKDSGVWRSAETEIASPVLGS